MTAPLQAPLVALPHTPASASLLASPSRAVREAPVLGCLPIARMDAAAVARAIAERDPFAPFAYVVTINAQILLLSERPESGLRPALDGAWLRLNDSFVLSRLNRLTGGERLELAAGSDLSVILLEGVLHPSDPVTIVGGGPDLLPALRARFGLENVAQHEPPMGYLYKPDAWEAAVRFVLDHPARIVFVATGAPRSERLLAEVKRRGATGVGIAVGSGLLFATGLTQRAPGWMRRHGLEWLHRAWTEPSRLGGRYAADLQPLLRLAWRAWRNQQRDRAAPP